MRSMSRKVKRSGNAVKVLGIAGASLAASASGSTALIMMDTTPFDVGNPDQAYTLNDEEISDVSLATFHFFNEKPWGHFRPGYSLPGVVVADMAAAAAAAGLRRRRGFGGGGCGGRGCGGRGCVGGWGGCGGLWWLVWLGRRRLCLSWGGCYYC